MPWIPKNVIEEAKKMDLLTYLKNYEPGELIREGSGYKTRSHGSLKISNGKWFWHAGQIGGRSAVDYLIKIRNMTFTEAVTQITGYVAENKPVAVTPEAEAAPVKDCQIPQAAGSNDRVFKYLTYTRGLDPQIVTECMKEGLIYETENYHNVAFVGKDPSGTTKLVTLRSLTGDFRNTTAGSDRHFPFRLVAKQQQKVVHLFEAPIDALSYATLHKINGIDWQDQNYLALCGVGGARTDDLSKSKVPVAVEQWLKDFPETSCICMHFDNDAAGLQAAKALEAALGSRGRIINQPPPDGYKDCNDFLKAVRHREREKQMQIAQ